MSKLVLGFLVALSYLGLVRDLNAKLFAQSIHWHLKLGRRVAAFGERRCHAWVSAALNLRRLFEHSVAIDDRSLNYSLHWLAT